MMTNIVSYTYGLLVSCSSLVRKISSILLGILRAGKVC